MNIFFWLSSRRYRILQSPTPIRYPSSPTSFCARPRVAVKAFERLGWAVVRQRGSHIIMTKEGHIATLSIPNHPEVARGTLRTLIARAGITVEEFIEAAK